MLQLVDRLARPVQVEQRAALVVEHRLRRVQVLGLVAVVDHPAAKRNQLAALVVDRDDDPLSESVPQLSPTLRPDRQTGIDYLAVGRAMLPQEADQVVLAVAGRGETKLEFGHRNPGDPTRFELDQRPLSGRVLQKDVVEILRRQQIEPLNRPFELPLPAGARRLLENDAGLLSQHPKRPTEIDVLDVLDEGEVVAPLLAAVAMPQLLFRRDI